MKDKLNRDPYAKKIADEIAKHYDTEKKEVEAKLKKACENIVFAISGKWGEGKTDLLRLLEKHLVKKGFIVIWFNPWKYSQKDITLKRAFLSTIQDELKSPINLDDLYYDRTKTILNINWLKLSVWIFFIVLFFYLFWKIFDINITNLIGIFLHFPIGIAIITILIIPILIKTISLNRKSANVSTAEQFEKKFIEILGNKEKIVIFVDDLDRCNPKTVKVILDSLRTFFQNSECSYVITADHTVVERYAGDELELTDGESPQKKLQEGRRFLKKLFDVYWRLPISTPHQFGIFVDDEINSSNIKFTEQQLSNFKSFLIDSDLFERNPRHVKRFITKLRFALDGVDLQKKDLEKKHGVESDSQEELQAILDNPDLLAKVLLFEEFFYPVYEKLILNPEELINHEKFLRQGEYELKIKGKKILDILDSKQEEFEKYFTLVKKNPKFTDENNSTIHEVANYFSFSGSTGLPSVLGPDERNFQEYLKTGQLEEKLGGILNVGTSEKKKNFVQKALTIFEVTLENDVERTNIIREGLKLSRKLEEWANELEQWKKKLFELPDDKQNELADIFWTVVLEKNPELITKVKNEKPNYFDLIWQTLAKTNELSLHPKAKQELETIIMSLEQPTNLKAIELYLQKFNSKNIENNISTRLDNPETCKTYQNSLKTIGIPEAKVSKIINEKLQTFLKNPDHFDWATSNLEFIKSVNLFNILRQNALGWTKDSKELIRIADKKDVLELTDDEKKQTAKKIPDIIKKSADLEFLNNGNLQSFLVKQEKIIIFSTLKDILASSSEALEKRKKSAELLMKNINLWSGIEMNDVYLTLVGINKLKLGRYPDLKDKPEEILNTWGYNETNKKHPPIAPPSTIN